MSWFQPTTTSLFAASSKNFWFSDPKAGKELNHENKTLQTPFRLLSGTPCPAILIFGEDWFDIIPCNHLSNIAPINHFLKRPLLNLDQSIGLCHTLGVVWWRRCEKLVGTKIEVEIFLKNTVAKWWKICPKIRKLVLFFYRFLCTYFCGGSNKKTHLYPIKFLSFSTLTNDHFSKESRASAKPNIFVILFETRSQEMQNMQMSLSGNPTLAETFDRSLVQGKGVCSPLLERITNGLFVLLVLFSTSNQIIFWIQNIWLFLTRRQIYSVRSLL